ncbi:MAG: PD40 domain-containing protein [Bacteroidetes bacterium]|nr:PD40 domain-containing protein [Bacteroidota bacterium]
MLSDREVNFGTLSKDGRYILYIDWNNESHETTAINLHDLHNGTNRVVSKVGTWKSPSKHVHSPVWSPDGKQFAYYWVDDEGEGERDEFHIANIDGTNDKVVLKGSKALTPLAWSSNGKYIVGTLDKQIVILTVNDSSIRVLKSFKGLMKKMDISPDNKYIVYSTYQSRGSEHNGIYLISMDGKIDKKIVNGATFDFEPLWTSDGKNILFISDRNGSNGLWKIRMEKGNTVGIPKLVKTNLGSLGNLINIIGLTPEGFFYYGTLDWRIDIHLVNMNLSAPTRINTSTIISYLNVRQNTAPAITKDGRYIAFVKNSLYADDEKIGRPFTISIYDTKTGKVKDTDIYMYRVSRLYAYYLKPQWSPDGKKLLILGRKKEKENIISAVFVYDIETKEIEPIIVIPEGKEYTDRPSTGTAHVFSKDGKSIYYLSTDGKNINKIEIKSKKNTVIYTNSKEMEFFKFSNNESKIAYVFNDNWNEVYVKPVSGGKLKKIVSLEGKNYFIRLIGWDSNDKNLYFINYENSTIMRVSAEGGDLEPIINLKDTFPDAKVRRVRDIVFDYSSSTMALEVILQNGGLWKLEGVLKD